MGKLFSFYLIIVLNKVCFSACHCHVLLSKIDSNILQVNSDETIRPMEYSQFSALRAEKFVSSVYQ